MAEEIVGVKIQVDGSDLKTSIGNLREEIVKTKGEIIKLRETYGANSDEVEKATKKLRDLQQSYNEKQIQYNKNNENTAKTISAITIAYGGLQGALSILGVSSEDSVKQLEKIQGALAVGEGIKNLTSYKDAIESTFNNYISKIKSSSAFQKINNALTATSSTLMKAFGVSVDTASMSFKVLKGAIAATGIGLLVVAVGELVTAFQNYESAAEKAKKAQENLNKSISEGAKTGLEAEMQFLENQKQLDIARAKNKGASEQEIFNIEQRYRKLKGESQIRYWKEVKDADKEGAKNALKEVEKINIEGSVAALDFDTKRKERIEKERKEAKEKAIKDAKDAADLLLKQEEGRTKARKAGEEFDALVAENREKRKEQEAKDEIKRIEDENKSVEDLFATEEKRVEIIIAANNAKANSAKKLSADELAAYEAKKTIQLAEVDLVLQLSGVLKQVAGKNKAIQAAAIIAENAAGIGRIIINTQVANAKAVAANPLGLGQPWVTINTISGALGVASSLLATKKALSELGGGGSAGSAPNIGGGVGGSAPLAPSSPQAQLTQLDQTSINRMGSATGRAYVVESDITNQQEKIIRINRAARLG